jgi:hypothetical protein
VRVIEQRAFGKASGGERGQCGGAEQHVHDDDLVADGGQWVEPGQDESGHGARKADQPNDFRGVDRGYQRGAQGGSLVR